MRGVLGCAFVLGLSAAAALAQVKETISVNVVEIPVTIVDRAGNPVRGLTKENFKLLEDGKERQITAFDTVDLTVKTGALDAVNPAARRNFLLLFDLSFTSPRSLANAQEAAASFVKNSVLPRDRVAVATLDLEHGFRLLTTFTSDRDLVTLAIHHPAGFKSGDPLQLSNESKVAQVDTTQEQNAEFLEAHDATRSAQEALASPGAMKRMADNKRTEQAFAVDTNRQIARSNDSYLRARVEKEVDFLGEIARTLRAVPGRKQIVFLSEGFDASVITGTEARSGEDLRAQNDAAIHRQFENIDTDARYGTASSQKFLSDMVKYFRGSDVVLHSIDIKGLRVQNSMEGATLNSNAGLSVLSAPTGGMLFQNANDLSLNFEKLLHAQELVYILSFRPAVGAGAASKTGQFHELSVKLVKVPGNPQVSARSGYWEGGGATRDERTLSAAEIILNDIPQDGLKVQAFTMAFPTSGDDAQVPVVLEIPGGDLIGAVRSANPVVEVYLYAFDENGGVKDRIFQRVSLDIGKLRERLYDSGLKFVATLSVPPGKYAIRSLVRVPESERRGYVRSELLVPDHTAVAMLQPVFIDANPSWVTIKGTAHGDAPYPFHINDTEFIPAATARIRSGETPQFAVYVQNAAPDEVTIDTTPKAKLAAVGQRDGRSAFLLQLDELAPSIANIDVTLHQKGITNVQTTSVHVEP